MIFNEFLMERRKSSLPFLIILPRTYTYNISEYCTYTFANVPCTETTVPYMYMYHTFCRRYACVFYFLVAGSISSRSCCNVLFILFCCCCCCYSHRLLVERQTPIVASLQSARGYWKSSLVGTQYIHRSSIADRVSAPCTSCVVRRQNREAVARFLLTMNLEQFSTVIFPRRFMHWMIFITIQDGDSKRMEKKIKI